MNKGLNNMMKKKPDQAIKHVKLNLTTRTEGLLRRVEKEKQGGLLIDLFTLIQNECAEAIKGIYKVAHDTPKPKRPRKRACGSGG